ncbi:hypothetical protein HOP52_13185 [Halomonas campisalis]|uniref:Uncharacterized protein n=1 Tax=Billgrantia campisalis TaxID=74661 RepID=A0ABS9PAC5_9GAMM|nr:hypothetical protein [Halomonas campisalis]MCG6658708.1 hypothetical protein [Halomonas campisalis]MDR5864027.1 hypothetical protein [Halomonas campisalis]
MAKRAWIPAAMALTLALGLAGCGEAEEEVAAPEAEESEAPATEAEPDEALDAEAPPPADEPLPGEQDALVDEQEVLGEDDLTPEEEVAADTETLGESPADTLDEGAALPGETTPDEIDAIIEEQERRFEEAQRRIDEQFDAVERDAPVFEPMEDTMDFETRLEPIEGDPAEVERDTTGTLDDEAALPGETTGSDIDALLEETERRFEEAQRRLEEQFEEAERRDPLEYEAFEVEEFEESR